MTWGVISLIEEVKSRIEQAKTDQNLSFKQVYIGSPDHYRKENDYPVVFVRPSSINIEPVCNKNGVVDDMNLNIVYACNSTANSTNTLYKTTNTSGMLYDLAVILNYLEKKTSDGSVNVDLNATAHDAPLPTITFAYDQNIILANISVSVKTLTYFRGTR